MDRVDHRALSGGSTAPDRPGAPPPAEPPATPPGPVPTAGAAEAVPAARVRSDSVIRADRSRLDFHLVLFGWIAANALFWSWWLRSEQVDAPVGQEDGRAPT
jgi:hypothetical protein